MSDLPQHGVLQQLRARSVSGEHLEMLGKQASAKWLAGESKTLSDAVIETVKHASLSPEQVKRVCEFANTDAYLTEFKKEGSLHRFIDFGNPGPASPADVIRSLNDGSAPIEYDQGHHYNLPPTEKKAAAEHVERVFNETFAVKDAPLPLHNPYGEVMELKDKLAAAFDAVGQEIEGLELQYADIADRVYQGVKQASLEGTELGKIVQAWSLVAPGPEYVKVAFQLFTPRLLRDGVFRDVESLSESLEKTAAPHRVVNEAHPLVLDFSMYCSTLQKLAEARATRDEIREPLGELVSYLKKEASAASTAGKVVGKGIDAVTSGARAAGGHVGDFVGEATGSPIAGSIAGGAVTYAPHLAALAGVNDLRNHAEQSPTYHRVLEEIPGTMDYRMKWGR